MEAHFPGEPGCRSIGRPCDADGWASTLPVDGAVAHVRLGATGGDGTRGLPHGTIGEALAAIGDGDTIAIAPGRYDELLVTMRPARFVGCGDTVLAYSGEPSVTLAALAPTHLEGLRVVGSRSGVNINADVTFRGVAIEDAILAIGHLAGAVDAEQLVIRRAATALSMGADASFTARSLEIVDGASSTIETRESTVVFEDTVVRDSGFSSDAVLLNANPGGSVSFARSAFIGIGTTRAFVIAASRLELTDCTVDGAPFASTRTDGGMVAFDGSQIAATRVRLSSSRFGGLGADGPGSGVTATDVWVRDLDFGADGGGGAGFEVGAGARMSLTRVLVERARTLGALATGAGTSLVMEDVTVREGIGDAAGTFGRALHVQDGASTTGTRTRFEASREAGAVVVNPGSTLEMTDATIAQTAERACAPTCPGAGIGIGVYLDGTASLRRFALVDNVLAGAQIARRGALDLAAGRVARNTVGINVQEPDYDVGRLTRDVSFEDNGVNLDSAELPIPDSAAP
jgi:hypothetical protein